MNLMLLEKKDDQSEDMSMKDTLSASLLGKANTSMAMTTGFDDTSSPVLEH